MRQAYDYWQDQPGKRSRDRPLRQCRRPSPRANEFRGPSPGSHRPSRLTARFSGGKEPSPARLPPPRSEGGPGDLSSPRSLPLFSHRDRRGCAAHPRSIERGPSRAMWKHGDVPPRERREDRTSGLPPRAKARDAWIFIPTTAILGARRAMPNRRCSVRGKTRRGRVAFTVAA